MAYGFVYILTNHAMPGIVKVGCTERSPGARAVELSNPTGVPLPFEVYAYIEVEDHQAVERGFHDVMKGRRLSNSREFFRCDPLTAWEMLQRFDSIAMAESDVVQLDRYYRSEDEKSFTAQQELARQRGVVVSALFGNVHDWWFDMGEEEGVQRIDQEIATGAANNVIEFGRRAA